VEVTSTSLTIDGSTTMAIVVFREVLGRREVNRMKSEFDSMFSHELWVPLTAIRFAGAARWRSARHAAALRSTDGQHYPARRRESSRLTREILDLERMDAGAFPLETRSSLGEGPG
jgi:signal transduction histidine kinase